MKWILYLEAFKSEQKIQIDSAAVVMEALSIELQMNNWRCFCNHEKGP